MKLKLLFLTFSTFALSITLSNSQIVVSDITPSSNYIAQNSKSLSYYQTQYKRWESVASRHYNTIKQTGISAERKRLFVEAQTEMQYIRQQAARDGFTISRSSWETIKL